MTDTTDMRCDVWATIGKISLVVGIVIGLKTLLWPIISRTPSLTAQAIYVPGNILPDLVTSAIPTPASTNLALLLEYNAYLQYTLWNPSPSPIADVIIDTPYRGFVHFTRSNEQQSPTLQFTNTIEVGTLRPLQSVIVSIWKTDALDVMSSRSRVTVSHNDGIARVSETLYTQGASLFIAKYWGLIGFVLFMVILFGGPWFFEHLMRKRLASEQEEWRRGFEREQTMQRSREQQEDRMRKLRASELPGVRVPDKGQP